jgi:TonB family protein
MVKITILFIVLVNILIPRFAIAQSEDSINCDEYFRKLDKVELITLWSKPPVLKENNAPIVSELCCLVSRDSCKRFVANFILDENGNPLCVKIHPEIINDTLKNEVTELLYKMTFEPAFGGHEQPVMSHYSLILDVPRCKMYKDMNIGENKKNLKRINDSILFCNKCDSLYNRICPPNTFGHPRELTMFPGGEREMMKFIANNLEYPEACKEASIQGRVRVEFIIDESGKVICPRILKSLHPAADEEALRVISLMPDWTPASNNDIPCKMCFTLPITFKL